ncbi:efflux RND transporter periplasmic adaptor subunit [bacterium]|nr:efflux RND transporter periplasmic adaptor subunit [bacterium]
MGKKTRLIIVLLLILIGVGFGARQYFLNDAAAPQRYRFAKVSQGEIKRLVSSTGTINPLNTVNVGSQISGIIKEIFVDFNSPVKKNQVIALIDDSVYAAQVEQARAKVLIAESQLREQEKAVIVADAGMHSAEANLFSARAALKLAKSQHRRQKNLLALKVTTQADLDAAEAYLNKARGDLNVATAAIQSSKAQYQRAISQVNGAAANIVDRKAALELEKIKLNYCTIISPINGIVIHRDVDVGQTVAATLQSPTLFTIAEDLSRMQLEVDVSESDVGLIQQDQQVSFTVDAFPEKKFKAVVLQIRNTPTSVQNVVTYKIIASVKNEALLLRPGMTANVSIEVARVENVLKVPNAALRFKPPEETVKKQTGDDGGGKNQLAKRLTEALTLTETQTAGLKEIIRNEGKKLQATAKTAENDDSKKKAYHDFMKAVITQLYPLLTPEQTPKMNTLIAQWRKAAADKSGENKPATVYIVDDQGEPLMVKVLSGISNEIETQILTRRLKAGDDVIVGIDFENRAERSATSSNPFMPGRGRR